MAYCYDKNNLAYTCGMGPDEKGVVSVSIGYELDTEIDAESLSFSFTDSCLTIKCTKELAAEIASAFAAVAEA